MKDVLIRTHELTKFYGEGEGTIKALRGASLTIDAGEFVAIMGPSGSGKSTFMHLLGCLSKPTSGTYRLSGKEVSALSRDELAMVRSKTIGFVFQNFNLLSRTSARENVELPMLYAGLVPAEREKRSQELLDSVGLGSRMKHKPNELSGGEQQRVAIARALANRAPLILGDEPTGNLDSSSSLEIMTLFKNLNEKKGITVVIVTHSIEVAAWFPRIVSFHDGLINYDGPASKLIPKNLRDEAKKASRGKGTSE